MGAETSLAVISKVLDLTTVIANATMQLQNASNILMRAHAEGREVSDAEVQSVISDFQKQLDKYWETLKNSQK